MTNVAAAPIRVRMSRILEAALVYVYVSPPEITSTDPINVSCQSIAITSPRILLASHAKVYRRGRAPGPHSVQERGLGAEQSRWRARRDSNPQTF